jgi:hypothetical protein
LVEGEKKLDTPDVTIGGPLGVAAAGVVAAPVGLNGLIAAVLGVLLVDGNEVADNVDIMRPATS